MTNWTLTLNAYGTDPIVEGTFKTLREAKEALEFALGEVAVQTYKYGKTLREFNHSHTIEKG